MAKSKHLLIAVKGNIENDHISHAASLRCTEIMEMIQKSLSYDEKTLLLLEKKRSNITCKKKILNA